MRLSPDIIPLTITSSEKYINISLHYNYNSKQKHVIQDFYVLIVFGYSDAGTSSKSAEV